MKRFVSGLVVGATISSLIGVCAAKAYIANPLSYKVVVNGKDFTSDPPPVEIEGRTYLPLRAVGEALGVPVKWNEELRQAEVGTFSSTPTITVDNDVQNNDAWKMTFLNCKTYTSISKFTKAEDGTEFVVATFELENISSEKKNFNFLYLNSYFDDFKTPFAIIGEYIDGASPLASATIDPGKKIKGYLSYQVKPGWNQLDVVYNENIFANDNENTLKFTIKNK